MFFTLNKALNYEIILWIHTLRRLKRCILIFYEIFQGIEQKSKAIFFNSKHIVKHFVFKLLKTLFRSHFLIFVRYSFKE